MLPFNKDFLKGGGILSEERFVFFPLDENAPEGFGRMFRLGFRFFFAGVMTDVLGDVLELHPLVFFRSIEEIDNFMSRANRSYVMLRSEVAEKAEPLPSNAAEKIISEFERKKEGHNGEVSIS